VSWALNNHYDFSNANENTVNELEGQVDAITQNTMNKLIEDGLSNGPVSRALRRA